MIDIFEVLDHCEQRYVSGRRKKNLKREWRVHPGYWILDMRCGILFSNNKC
jgi:hypothetical protein